MDKKYFSNLSIRLFCLLITLSILSCAKTAFPCPDTGRDSKSLDEIPVGQKKKKNSGLIDKKQPKRLNR